MSSVSIWWLHNTKSDTNVFEVSPNDQRKRTKSIGELLNPNKISNAI